jgi:ubiquinone/menaquinone biosynthesis C-methylase UbiE
MQTIWPGGGDTALPLNLRKRMAAIERCAGPLERRRVLDCGCGAGDYLDAIERRGAVAVGVECWARKLESPRRSRAGARLVEGDLEALAFPDRSFDVALLNEVLEHVPDDRRALVEVFRVLRPGGRLVLLSPTRLHPFETHGVFWRGSGRRVSHAVPFVPWLPRALAARLFDAWARNYGPFELRRLVREAGFRIVHTGALWQTFENISGQQPRWIRALAPWLRLLANACERVPGLRAFGVSQLIVAERPV